MAHGRDAVFFTDEDFVWVEPTLESTPTLPTVVPRPRPARRARPTRTFAGDLARLREEVSALPPRAIALLGAGLLAGVLVLVLVLALPVGEAPKPADPPKQATQAPVQGAGRPVNARPRSKRCARATAIPRSRICNRP